MEGRAAVILVIATLSVAPSCETNTRSPAAPVPSPAPPAPTPEPTPPGCGLPPGTGSGTGCRRELPVFALDVNHAIAKAQNEHPEYFDFSSHQGGLSYRVVRRDEYIAEVVANLKLRGLCALYDGVEVAVKNANEYNEQYNVHTSQGFVRWGAGAYISTCRPAWF
ncbi:MAG TPA: hypothetical protein VMT87_05875 [Vicinamibacteria bacterium]|nr:hypothetical protein [Vicinamibacteria bacterium]